MSGTAIPRSRLLDGGRRVSAVAAAPVAAVIGVLAPLAFHWAAGKTLAWFDTAGLYAPERWLVDEALRAFRLPLWNPFAGGGMPFFADGIHGVLHPVSVLAAWLRTERSVDVLIGGYVACAGLGAWLLARELGASRASAAVAAFAYALSGHVLSMAGNLVFLAGGASLPFCAAGLRRVAAELRPATLAYGVAGTAAVALSGDVQALVVAGALALALAWEAASWRGAVRAAAAGALGLAVAGVQLVASAAHAARSVRNAGTWHPPSGIWSLEPWRVPELVVPGLLWGPDPLRDGVFEQLAGPGGWIPGGPPIPFTASVAIGLVPLALAVAAVRDGRRGRLLGALSLVLLWIALGPALGASAVLARVPVWSAFRYAEKLVGPLTLVLALLAALGADAVVEGRVRARWVLGAAVALALASVVACRLAIAGLAPDLAAAAGARVARGAWLVALGAAGLVGWLPVRRRLGPSRQHVALAALVWTCMVAASPAALRPGDPAARLRPPGPSLAAAAPGPRILTPYTYEPSSIEPGRDPLDVAIGGHAAKGYAAHNVRARIDSFSEYSAMAPKALNVLKVAFGARWAEAARRYGATHVIVDPPRTERHRALHAIATRGGTRVDQGGPAEIWEVPHREWASFPSEVHAVASPSAAAVETAAAFIRHSAAAVVEAPPGLGAAAGRVLSVERGLESVRVEAEADGDATLVVADAWWPGWEATLDGTAVPIFRAELLVRAVRWPPGRHVLEMHYRPPEVRAGLAVSAAGLAAVAVCAVCAVFLRRRAANGRRERP